MKEYSKEVLNIAVVGAGYWGPNLIRNFRSLKDAWLKTVCDVDERRLDHIRKLYPDIQITTDFSEVLKDASVDAVAIATPVRFHYEMAMKCLESGKHVFIEKPMAASVGECLSLLDMADRNNVKLMVGHTFAYSAPVRKIKEIYAAGELGEIQYISSRRLNLGLFQNDINVAWDLAPHDISIILHIIGKEPVSVNCQGKAHINPSIEDVTNMTLNFDNGGFAMIHSSWLDPNKTRETTFVGSKKMLVYNDIESNEKIKIYDKRVEAPPHYDTFAEFHYSYHYGDMHSPHLSQSEPLKIECRHFVDCIKNGTTPITSGQEGLKVVRILEAASLSLKDGGGNVKLDEVFPINSDNGRITKDVRSIFAKIPN